MRSTLKIDILKEMRSEHFPDFMFLLETKNSSSYIVNVQKLLGYDQVHVVDPESLSGGLAFFGKLYMRSLFSTQIRE